MRRLLVILNLSLAFIFTGVAISQESSSSPSSSPSTGDAAAQSAAHGKELFAQKCSICHQTSEEKKIGPGLKGISKRNFTGTTDPVTDEALKHLIVKGKGIMPAFEKQLDADQVNNLVAYLDTL